MKSVYKLRWFDDESLFFRELKDLVDKPIEGLHVDKKIKN